MKVKHLRVTVVFIAWLAFLLVRGPHASLWAQAIPAHDRVPAWVLYQMARVEMVDRNFGVALQRFGEALAEQPFFPEARAGMAAVFAAEGDYLLAERYYRQAVAQARQLNIPDEEVLIRLELATLLRRQGRVTDYRRELETIIERDEVFSDRVEGWRREAMSTLLIDRGLDRVLVLYRLSNPIVTQAHIELGRYYLDQQDSKAIDHLLFATVELISRTVSAVIDRYYNYQFTSLSELLSTVQTIPLARDFVRDARVTEVALDLAAALPFAADPRARLVAADIVSALE